MKTIAPFVEMGKGRNKVQRKEGATRGWSTRCVLSKGENDMELGARAAGGMMDDQRARTRGKKTKNNGQKKRWKEGQRAYEKGGVYAERQDADGPIS